jgi:hypothetical protein
MQAEVRLLMRPGIVVVLLLVGLAVLMLTVQPSASSSCAQETIGNAGSPPVGDSPEPDEEITQQILEILLTAQAEGRTADRAEVVALLMQLTPDLTIVSGGYGSDSPPVVGRTILARTC